MVGVAKVGIYCDGFNIYYGLRSYYYSTGQCLYWLDIRAFCQALATRRPYGRPEDTAAIVKYFTADPVTADQRLRHQNYYSMIRSRGGVDVIDGRYSAKQLRCKAQCKLVYQSYEEKETDVNIGLQVLHDAYQGLYYKLVLVSSDSDFVPVLRMIRAVFPSIMIIVLAPLGNSSGSRLGKYADCHIKLKKQDYLPHVLPPVVTAPSGMSFTCPATWR
jgi:uncharacterized LabA/DUF88 family protein